MRFCTSSTARKEIGMVASVGGSGARAAAFCASFGAEEGAGDGVATLILLRSRCPSC